MKTSLIDISRYGVITFAGTSHALKAEKVMKREEKQFIIIPTLREISSSCGLSLKFDPQYIEEFCRILIDQKVQIDKVYMVQEEGREKLLEQVNIEL